MVLFLRQVIRIWDIVLNRHHMKRTIELIIKSHDRGGECLLQKQLKVCVRGRGVSATETAQGMCDREGSVYYRNNSRYV